MVNIKTGLKSLEKEIIADADLVVITAAHTNIDYKYIAENAQAIFDAKNAMKNIDERDNIEVL